MGANVRAGVLDSDDIDVDPSSAMSLLQDLGQFHLLVYFLVSLPIKLLREQ